MSGWKWEAVGGCLKRVLRFTLSFMVQREWITKAKRSMVYLLLDFFPREDGSFMGFYGDITSELLPVNMWREALI